jgi:translocator protein
MRNLRLMLFVVLVLGTGFAAGLLNPPGSWYAALAKPWFNPPNWVFAPVWSIVYLLVAIAGWRTWERDRNSMAMTLWWAQMALNFLWSPIFFTAHRPAVALAVILMLLVAILAFIARQWSADRFSAVLFIPYAAWVGFASVLNFEIVRLN